MTGCAERQAALAFRLAIRACPAGLKADFEEEMTDTFREAYRVRGVGTGAGPLARLRSGWTWWRRSGRSERRTLPGSAGADQ